MKSMGVFGAGAWGTALATAGVRAGLDTCIWARENEVVNSINTHHENTLFLPDISLDADLRATADVKDIADRDFILMVAPAQHTRTAAEALKPHIRPGIPLIICSKGIEVSTGKLLSEVLEETLPDNPVGILSGPTFAVEVARGLPCALTLAINDTVIGEQITQAIGQPTFRPYLSTDIAGAQIGGAVKNVLAIATGMVAGLDLGENARAAIITRGLAEIMRFGALYGAKPQTLRGLSGLGDLILTCSSTQSRNMSLGKAIGEGQTMQDIMAGRRSVAEGAHTVEIVYSIAQEKGIDMPITAAVYAILKDGKDVHETTQALLSRPYTTEI